ncbi:hypothetical protein [Streptomyces sp. NPDC001389]|uniref:hypothetical protein n=1 Tax=Streptomyces sp. NPDC001389 TaxID=3364569 RepID=UPI003695CFF4
MRAELEAVRPQVVAALEAGDAEAERALTRVVLTRLAERLRDRPELTAGLDRLHREELAPLVADGRTATGSMVMRAKASGHGRVYQAGRDQHITDR